MRAAIPGVTFALEFDEAFGHEPAYPDWSFDDEAVELVGSVEKILAQAAPGGPLLKMLAHHPELPRRLLRAGATHRGTGCRDHPLHWSSLVEFSAPGVTKASTLLAWSGRLGAVGHPYAMSNAHPDVLAATGRRAPSNDEDGVAQVLEGFVDALAGRPAEGIGVRVAIGPGSDYS